MLFRSSVQCSAEANCDLAVVAESIVKREYATMQPHEFVCRQDGEFWIGYLKEFPDNWTQGDSLADLVEHLQDLRQDLHAMNLS